MNSLLIFKIYCWEKSELKIILEMNQWQTRKPNFRIVVLFFAHHNCTAKWIDTRDKIISKCGFKNILSTTNGFAIHYFSGFILLD
jgi:hypothetical protein